jgi:peptidoglycan hydrolase-like protein with peptidoglycan-binding domain
VQRAASADEVAAGSAEMSVMPPAARPVLARGASGRAVATMQAALAAASETSLVADGEYGAQTAALVCLVQRWLDLKVDGIVGPATWQALDLLTEPLLEEGTGDTSGEGVPGAASPSPAPGGAATGQPAVQREEEDGSSGESQPTSLTAGSVGPWVASIQSGLSMAYPNAGVKVDGTFGAQTLAFVLLYQVDHGLVPDGIVGPETRKHLDPVESVLRKVAAAQELASFNQDMSDIDNLLDLRAIPPAIVRDMKTLKERDF